MPEDGYLQPERETRLGPNVVRRSWPRLRIQTRDAWGGRVRLQRKTYYSSAGNKTPIKKTWTIGIKLSDRTTVGGKVNRKLLSS